MEEKSRKTHWGGLIFLILVVVGVGVALNWRWLYDFYRGKTYQPSAEMVRIRSDLQLTERGEFLFNASQPALNEREEFNAHCRDGVTESAVLGCYTVDNIYVYNITDAELDGIRELTTAHELLHANWARMSEDERVALVEPLTRTFEANQSILEEEINTYDASQKQEELYVRAGTEIANLPDVLEKHYAEIFKDQDAVVAFYDKYIAVFRALDMEMSDLKTEMEGLNAEVEAKIAEYERRADQLDADVVSFNSCAVVTGCFKTEEEFLERRNALVGEQEALEALYNEIDGLISDYNTRVELYNADVSHGEKLNDIMNSLSAPKKLE